MILRFQEFINRKGLYDNQNATGYSSRESTAWGIPGPMNISQSRLAKDISVPPRRINEIVKEKRGITTDTALRLSRYFGTSAQFWMNLQNQYELDVLKEWSVSAGWAREARPSVEYYPGYLSFLLIARIFYSARPSDKNESTS